MDASPAEFAESNVTKPNLLVEGVLVLVGPAMDTVPCRAIVDGHLQPPC